MYNSEVYNRLNRLLFVHKVNQGCNCNIKKLSIPILDEEQQMRMERYIDEEYFEGIEVMMVDIFHI